MTVRKDNVIQVRVSTELKEQVLKILPESQLSDLVRDALEELVEGAKNPIVEIGEAIAAESFKPPKKLVDDYQKKLKAVKKDLSKERTVRPLFK